MAYITSVTLTNRSTADSALPEGTRPRTNENMAKRKRSKAGVTRSNCETDERSVEFCQQQPALDAMFVYILSPQKWVASASFSVTSRMLWKTVNDDWSGSNMKSVMSLRHDSARI